MEIDVSGLGFKPGEVAVVTGAGNGIGRATALMLARAGDLRRLLEREGGAALSRTAGEAMNAHPRTIAASELAATALAILEERKITSLIVIDGNQIVEGVVHLHDLWGVELI